MSADWAASTLAWWHEAGVDTIVGERPRDWLKPTPAPAPAVAIEAAPAPAAPDESLPGDLPAFQRWLMESPAMPLAGPNARRTGPTGDPTSGLMVMIDMPASAAALFVGEVADLFGKMMAAIGRSAETVYLAPLSVVRTPTARLNAADLARLAPVARHHVGLVRPRALLLFGNACAQAMLGGPVFETRGRWHEVETAAGPVRTIATIRPENMVRNPNLKRSAWEDLQMVMAELKA
jgi:DNA polymerase